MNAYNYLVFRLTDKCNTVCRYCFNDSRPGKTQFLPFQTIRKCVDWCADRADGKLFAQFTGGEPLLHPDIWEILRYAGDKGFSLRLQTNGLLFDRLYEAHLKLLARPNQVFKISLDGYDEATHDAMRARGTFQQIMKGITIVRRYHPRYCVKSVLSSAVAANFQKMLDLSLAIGACGISYNFLRPEGRAVGLTNPIDEYEFTERAIELFNQDKYRHLLNGSRVLEIWMYPQSYLKAKFFYINCDGNVYPSQDLRPNECIGNASLGVDCLDESRIISQKWEVPIELYQLVKTKLEIQGINQN